MGQRANAAGARTSHSVLDLGDLVEVFCVGQAKCAHTERVPRFLEMPLKIFPTTVFLVMVHPVHEYSPAHIDVV